jgi:hypothetical protein
MEWWLIGLMALVIVTLVAIYRKSLQENRVLAHYAIILLLHDGIYRDHQTKLAQYVSALDAKNAFDLGSKVYIAVGNMAAQLKDSMALAAGLLWDLKTGSARVPKDRPGAHVK